MKVDVLKRVMETELGWKRDGALFSVKDGVKATVLLSSGKEIVPVPRFTSVRFDDDVIVFETEEGHFFADPGALFALRTEGDEKRLDKRPGFHG
jgi:hypothetical protein